MSYSPTITSVNLDLLLESPFAMLYETIPRYTRIPQDLCDLIFIYLCDQWVGWQEIPTETPTGALSTHSADIVMYHGEREWHIDITGNMLQRGVYQRYPPRVSVQDPDKRSESWISYHPMEWNNVVDVQILHQCMICAHAHDIMTERISYQDSQEKYRDDDWDEVEDQDEEMKQSQSFIDPDLQISTPSLIHRKHQPHVAWGNLCNPTTTWTHYRMFWARDGLGSVLVPVLPPTSQLPHAWYVCEIHLLGPRYWLVLQIQPHEINPTFRERGGYVVELPRKMLVDRMHQLKVHIHERNAHHDSRVSCLRQL